MRYNHKWGGNLALTGLLVAGLLIVNGPMEAAYKVILKDGRALEARSKPISMEGQYRFTALDGKFYVMTLEQIDLKATRNSNSSSSDSGEKGNTVRPVYTDETMPDGKEAYPDPPSRSPVPIQPSLPSLNGQASRLSVETPSGIELFDDAMRERLRWFKPVALYFYATWCPYCRQLEKLLATQEVQQYLDSLLYVPINVDAGEKEKALFMRYGGSGVPHFLILPAQSNQATRISPFTRNPEKKSILKMPSDFIQDCKNAGG